MKLEVGKKYLTRDGAFVVEVTEKVAAFVLPISGTMRSVGEVDPTYHDTADNWTHDGYYWPSGSADSLDLVSEYTDNEKETPLP